jgi:hypothetical protein
LRGTLTMANNAIAYGATANTSIVVPPGTKLAKLQLNRSVAGAAPNINYSATAVGVPLESASGANVAAADKSFDIPDSATGSNVQLSLSCAANPCAATAPAALDVGRIGMKVVDTSPPAAAVGGYHSPAKGSLDLDFVGTDVGTGLRYAKAWVTSGPVTTVEWGGADCRDLTPDATVDMPLDAKCVFNDHAKVTVDLGAFSDGPGYTLNYQVVDWAGNETSYTQPLEVTNKVNLGQASQTLSIGTSDNSTPTVNANTNNGGKSGVAGQSSQNCTTPRLSFSLSQKPMRISKGVPVLQSGKRYRFNGRLTCVINKKRRSAPKGARVELTNKIGKKTYTKTGTTVRSDGKLTIILSYKTSRTVIFRFTNSDGKRSQVSIKVKVEKKKTSKR